MLFVFNQTSVLCTFSSIQHNVSKIKVIKDRLEFLKLYLKLKYNDEIVQQLCNKR